jgi:hypothetical protein
MLDFEAGSQNSLPSIIREEIPMLSLRLCFMLPQKRTKVKDSRPWINTEIRQKSEKATKTLQAEKEDR